tara:strand:- start:1 stop:162 length:162 start_codon:yes stop_codon:yes gene_type:complete
MEINVIDPMRSKKRSVFKKYEGKKKNQFIAKEKTKHTYTIGIPLIESELDETE